MGPSDSGKYAAIKEFLNNKASGGNVPWEWCYVNNFEKSHHPLYLKFPAGRATEFIMRNSRDHDNPGDRNKSRNHDGHSR